MPATCVVNVAARHTRDRAWCHATDAAPLGSGLPIVTP